MYDEIHVFGSINDTDLPDLATYQDMVYPYASRVPPPPGKKGLGSNEKGEK